MKNLPKPLYYFLVVMIAIFAMAAGRYVARSVYTQYQLDQATNQANNPNSEPVISEQFVKEQVMAGCMQIDISSPTFNQRAYCECSYNQIVQVKGVNWILANGLKAEEPDVQAQLRPFAEKCLLEQGISS